MGILQIIRLLSIPLCFYSTIGILFLFKKKRLYILILLLIGCIGWRLLSTKDSSRYAIALIIPTTILCGYAGDCFTKITKVASQKQLYIIIVVVSILAMVLPLLITTLHFHTTEMYYIQIGKKIEKDAQQYSSSIVIDFSKKNALRYKKYSGNQVVQENESEYYGDSFFRYLNQRISNYSKIYDSLYFIVNTSNKKIQEINKEIGLKPIIEEISNKNKGKKACLYKYIKGNKEYADGEYYDIWSDAMEEGKESESEVSNKQEKKISIPSKLIPKGWYINLQDGCHMSAHGVVEWKERYEEKSVLHMSSEKPITVVSEKSFYPVEDGYRFQLCYKALKDSVFSVRIYYYNKSSQYLGAQLHEIIYLPAMKTESVLLYEVDASKYTNAYYFKIAISLQQGDIDICSVKLQKEN